jgi:hypothetical protein
MSISVKPVSDNCDVAFNAGYFEQIVVSFSVPKPTQASVEVMTLKIYDFTHTLFDPDAVQVEFLHTDDIETNRDLFYYPGSGITRQSTGIYTLNPTVAECSGEWKYRVTTFGPNFPLATQGSFYVTPT